MKTLNKFVNNRAHCRLGFMVDSGDRGERQSHWASGRWSGIADPKCPDEHHISESCGSPGQRFESGRSKKSQYAPAENNSKDFRCRRILFFFLRSRNVHPRSAPRPALKIEFLWSCKISNLLNRFFLTFFRYYYLLISFRILYRQLSST
ncbi:PREDICTED: uncharacterized protein LOC105569347 isoform X2 [Vollenhovia emeryi]|uniref:uncharacterized protein LOC105569347 isoform X2 n=1 Tax=Vollenhovia emeryi TaxID=411798 RepID=UPI0005F46D87|nr:PREDICTED: uncharacterized protein LOC105569347 isoform X2 [Vollenhovia emeryi]